MTQRNYYHDYTDGDQVTGGYVVSTEGRMLGGEFAIPMESIRAALANTHIIVSIADLPTLTQDGEGKPRLPAEPPVRYRDNSAAARADAFRDEAMRKLALARWWDFAATRQGKQAAKLVQQLDSLLHSGDAYTTEDVARQLVEAGWKL